MDVLYDKWERILRGREMYPETPEMETSLPRTTNVSTWATAHRDTHAHMHKHACVHTHTHAYTLKYTHTRIRQMRFQGWFHRKLHFDHQKDAHSL